MNYSFCPECGTALILKEHRTDGAVPYCPHCQRYRHPPFNTAVSMVVRRESDGKILLILQYGKPGYILVAGYINRGESAENAVVREVKEETGLSVKRTEFNRTRFFEPSDTLMCNFTAIVDGLEEVHTNDEVDGFEWFTPDEARRNVRHGSLAAEFLNAYLDGHPGF